MSRTAGGELTLAGRSTAPSVLDRLARRGLLSRLAELRDGEIELREGAERRTFGRASADSPLKAVVEVRSPRFYSEVALGGSIGAGEAYMRGLWSVDDLTALVRILVRNRELMDRMEGGLARLKAPFLRLLHLSRRNTRSRSRVNIGQHYDLGNEFFSLFLDPTLMYSCAEFEAGDENLERASLRKIDRICEDLKLSPGDELLEIGTGWGGLALRAASRYGCRVVTTTISRKQHERAAARVREAGLEDRITVVLEDYRDLPRRLGRRFPKMVSVEMVEAVGHDYLDTYFRTCGELLEPGGAMLLQAIVIADPLYESYRRSVDFIQRYIFPGGALPSVAAIRASLARATGLEVRGVRDISEHYPPTLRAWRRSFAASVDRIRDLGYSDEFIRMWEFYFCYAEGGFLEGTVADVQLLLGNPGPRRSPAAAGG